MYNHQIYLDMDPSAQFKSTESTLYRRSPKAQKTRFIDAVQKHCAESAEPSCRGQSPTPALRPKMPPKGQYMDNEAKQSFGALFAEL